MFQNKMIYILEYRWLEGFSLEYGVTLVVVCYRRCIYLFSDVDYNLMNNTVIS